MRNFAVIVAVWLAWLSASATTLQQLSVDDLIGKASLIVRGRPRLANTTQNGRVIFTHYLVQVTEQWKGTPVNQVDVAVPGGTFNGAQQSYTGAPSFSDGQERIFFLWTSRSGLNQVLGLTQGVFNFEADASGNLSVVREASSDRMLDRTGKLVLDKGFRMALPDFKGQVQAVLGSARGN